MHRSLRSGAFFLVSCSVGGALSAQDAPRITVLAESRFEVERRTRVEGAVELRVRLLDDGGVALPEASVSVGSSDRAQRVSACGGARAQVRHSFTTDSEGAICLRVPEGAASVRLSYAGGPLHLPADAQIDLVAGSDRSAFRFELPSLELELDRPLHELRLSGAGDVASNGSQLELELSAEGRRSALDVIDPVAHGDDLSFQVRSDQLGSPGPARILARRRRAHGEPDIAEAVALRIATVQLSAEVGATDGANGSLQVAARTRHGPPTSGWIDAEADGQTLTSAPLVEGSARVDVPLPAGVPRRILLRYRAEDSSWQAGAPLEITLEPAGSPRAARWPWLVLLAPIGYVCARALLRPGPRRPRPRPPAASAEPDALQIEPSHTASGWSGLVRDAHEGTPIPGARVQVSLPSLRAPLVHAVAVTDASGRFVLPPLPSPIPEGASFQVTAPLHTEVHRSLPPQGRVDVALSSRRRALLRRLVRWARSSGLPWQGPREPTPGEIADVALRRGEMAIADWAERVGAAAFGAAEVDAAREAELREREPGARHSRAPREHPHGDG